MTLRASFADLYQKLDALETALSEDLVWTVTEGRPPDADHIVAERYDSILTDLLGTIEAAKRQARLGEEACSGSIDVARARNALVNCQRGVNVVVWRFLTDLASVEAGDALNDMRCDHEQLWQSWVDDVKAAVLRSRRAFESLLNAPANCWHELSERLG